jgi:hypothetical protein
MMTKGAGVRPTYIQKATGVLSHPGLSHRQSFEGVNTSGTATRCDGGVAMREIPG